MKYSKSLCVALLVLVAPLVPSVATGIAKSKKKKATPTGTPVMWRQPTNIGARDLFLGPGGTSMQPDLSRIKLLKEEKGGYSKQYRTRDGAGHEGVAKVDRKSVV